MKFVLFYHSLVFDWNHGKAHFLRGIVAVLLAILPGPGGNTDKPMTANRETVHV